MKTSFTQLAIFLSAAATLTVAAPAANEEEMLAVRQYNGDDASLRSLCSSSRYHCVYAQDDEAFISRRGAFGCDSRGTTCVFRDGARGYARCPGGRVRFSFGPYFSLFRVRGDAEAYFSSHDGDTSAKYSYTAGDDLHVSCSDDNDGPFYGNRGNGPTNSANELYNDDPYGNDPYVDSNMKKAEK